MVYEHYNVRTRLGDIDYENLTAIDLGCGACVSEVAKQVIDMPFKELTSVEGYKPDFTNMKKLKFSAKKHKCVLGDVKDIDETKYDIVMMFDVLEHLTKEEGNALLDKFDRICRQKVVLFFPDEPDDFHRIHTADDNKLQEHLSYWREGELSSRGYKVERIMNCHSEQMPDGNYKYFDALWATKTYV